MQNAPFITSQGRSKIRKCHTKTSTAKLCELLRQIVRKAINCMHSLSKLMELQLVWPGALVSRLIMD